MNARVAFFVMVALTMGAILVLLFQRNWILGVSAAAVMAGTGFVGASLHLRKRENPPPGSPSRFRSSTPSASSSSASARSSAR